MPLEKRYVILYLNALVVTVEQADRLPLDLSGGLRQSARAQRSHRFLGGGERRGEILAQCRDLVEEPQGRGCVDSLYRSAERLSRGDRSDLSASAGTIAHCPSVAQLARLRLVEGAQGGGSRAQPHLHGRDGRASRATLDGIRGAAGRLLSDDRAELARELSEGDPVLPVPGRDVDIRVTNRPRILRPSFDPRCLLA